MAVPARLPGARVQRRLGLPDGDHFIELVPWKLLQVAADCSR